MKKKALTKEFFYVHKRHTIDSSICLIVALARFFGSESKEKPDMQGPADIFFDDRLMDIRVLFARD